MYLYIKILENFIRSIIKLNKYYYYTYNPNEDMIKINDITLIYYLLNFFLFFNKNLSKRILKNYYNVDENVKLIKINDMNCIMLEEKSNISPITPKGVIDNIVIDVRNHRYNLNKLKLNLFKIDSDVPLIFCLFYFENICKIDNIKLTVNYIGENKNYDNFFKINDIDKISAIL